MLDVKKQDIEVLINKALKKDQMAITELYNLTYRQGYSLARQMVKDEQEAYDIMQESYLTAFRKLDTLNDPCKFQNWFYTIIANKCRDYLRKHKNVVFSELTKEEDDWEFEDTLENENMEFCPEESVDYSETKRLMNEILQNLSSEQRMCILLYYYEQMSVKEIANIMECSENTVKTRLSYARKKIESDVKVLEKKGTKLYSISAIPFMVWMLRVAEQEIFIPTLGESVFSAEAVHQVVAENLTGTTAAKTTVTKASVGKVIKTGAVIKKQIGIVAVVTTLTVGGTMGAKVVYDIYQEKQGVIQQTDDAIILEQIDEENLEKEQELIQQTEKEDAILEQIDEETLEKLFYYIPYFDEGNPVKDEEVYKMVESSMEYMYLNSMNDLSLPTLVAEEKLLTVKSEKNGDDSNSLAVKEDSFDDVLKKIGFEKKLDENFFMLARPDKDTVKTNENEIVWKGTGNDEINIDWEVSIDKIERAEGKIQIQFTRNTYYPSTERNEISYRVATLEQSEDGYSITSIVMNPSMSDEQKEETILGDINEYYLKNLLYYAPYFSEHVPITDEEMGYMIHASLFFENCGLPSIVGLDYPARENQDVWVMQVADSAFDEAAYRLNFSKEIDENFIESLGIRTLSVDNGYINLDTDGRGAWASWEISIDEYIRSEGKIKIRYTHNECYPIRYSERTSYRIATLELGDYGYVITNISAQ